MYPIASYNLNSGSSTAFVTFTNIPSNFTHLQLRVFARSTNSSYAPSCYTFFNNDIFGGATYARHNLYGDGTSANSSASASVNSLAFNWLSYASTTANVYTSYIMDVLDYSSTVKNKTVKVLQGFDANGSGTVAIQSGLWMNTSAINRVDFASDTGFAQYTRFDLYGISTSNATGA
jgi:hypothetical protein